MNYVLNPNHDNGKATCPKTGIVSLINDEETSYKTYTLVYSQIRVAYDEMRDDMSNELFGKNIMSNELFGKNSQVLTAQSCRQKEDS